MNSDPIRKKLRHWGRHVLFTLQSQKFSSQAVSRLPNRACYPAGVGEWRTSSTDNQLSHQLSIWPVSIFYTVLSLFHHSGLKLSIKIESLYVFT